MSDFDPLAQPNSQSEVMPLISVPFGAVPLNPAPAFFQGAPETAYSNTEAAPFATNPQYVVPITWGMSPTTVGQDVNGDTQQSSTNPNGFHDHPIMVLPQQQPIMFQQFGGMPHVPTNVIPGPPAPTNGARIQQQQHYPAATQQQQQTSEGQRQQTRLAQSASSGGNPFDPLT